MRFGAFHISLPAKNLQQGGVDTPTTGMHLLATTLQTLPASVIGCGTLSLTAPSLHVGSKTFPALLSLHK